MPDTIHGAIQSNVAFELKLHYRHLYRVLSEVSLATIPDSTTPDVLLYPAFALDFENRTAKRTDAPLLCVEIQSPSQSLEQMVDKTDLYFNFGVRSCWIVAPAVKGVFVYDQPGQYAFYHHTDILHDAVLGLDVDLTAVFA